MKILFLTAYFSPERVASSYLGANRNHAFAEAGFMMEVYTPIPSRGMSKNVRSDYKKRKIEWLYNGKMQIRRFNMIREGNNPILRAVRYTLCALKHYYFAIRAKGIDVLFISSTPPIQGAMAAMVKKRTGIPIVYNLQDIFPDSLVGAGLAKKGGILWKIGRKIEDFTYRNVDKIIVISQDFKRNIMAKGVPNTILFAGHVIKTKGVEELVEACGQIENVKLKIIGHATEEMKDLLRQKASKCKGHDSWLELTGELPYEQVLYQMQRCDLFVLPTYTEGFPNVILESMACGCAIVTTNVGAIPEILTDDSKGKYGIMVEPKNAEALASAIKTLQNDENLKKQCRENARRRVFERYSMPIVWNKLQKTWCSL